MGSRLFSKGSPGEPPVEIAGDGTFLQYPGAPYKFDGRSLDRWKRAPLIGEDNLEIYQGELGLSDEELERLSSIHAI